MIGSLDDARVSHGRPDGHIKKEKKVGMKTVGLFIAMAGVMIVDACWIGLGFSIGPGYGMAVIGTSMLLVGVLIMFFSEKL